MELITIADLNRVLRPKSWDNIVGQTEIKDICRKAVEENKFPRFSIFYGPTGVGKSCLAELIAMQITGHTGDIDECTAIRKYNMAALVGKKDIVEVIESIFKYKSVTSGSCVYILEEVQVLKQKEEQTPFLEELTKIPDNVYIMMCTTRISALTLELRNRAVAFQLLLPSYEECEQLITNVTEQLGFAPLTDRAKSVLIRASDYTPRSIIKHIELLASNDSISETDINRFFKVVSNADFITVLAAVVNPNVTLYNAVTIIKDVLDKNYVQNYMYGLRDFTIQYLIEQASGQYSIAMTKAERKLCKDLLNHLNEAMFVKVFDALSKLNTYTLEDATDTLAFLIGMKITVMGKSAATIVQNNKSAASETQIESKHALHSARNVGSTKEITPITAASNLSAFGMGDTVYEE